MHHFSPKRLFLFLTACCLIVFAFAIAPPAEAFNNPDLLPKTPTPLIDLANSLTSLQEENLAQELEQFEQDTGWRLRVLTQYERTPGLAIRDFWQLDDKSVLLVADPRGGNLLNFNVGDDVYKLLTRTFWVELQTRYGNLYFVRDNGEDGAILGALHSIEICLQRQEGCRVVPGLPKEQWLLTLMTSVVGGIVLGFAAYPRKEGQLFAWQWALIFSPLWGILFIAFGIGPVVSRTSEWLPLFRNALGFILGALVAYLSPVVSRPSASEPSGGR